MFAFCNLAAVDNCEAWRNPLIFSLCEWRIELSGTGCVFITVVNLPWFEYKRDGYHIDIWPIIIVFRGRC